ncbi:hypothetical protein ACFWMR_01825 [Amycolatopsis thailandensis]|uniref:hypothetical protein n=1 Tax=Amycolatopsis thailandensis TaxID=589330 RepID=UPI003665E581
MVLAADAASTPPWLALALGVFTLLGVIATAAGPAIVERIKNAAGKQKDPKPEKPDPPAPSTPAVVQRTDQALDLVEKAMVDAQAARDKAQARVETLLQRIDDLEAELYRRDPLWNGGSNGQAS